MILEVVTTALNTELMLSMRVASAISPLMIASECGVRHSGPLNYSYSFFYIVMNMIENYPISNKLSSRKFCMSIKFCNMVLTNQLDSSNPRNCLSTTNKLKNKVAEDTKCSHIMNYSSNVLLGTTNNPMNKNTTMHSSSVLEISSMQFQNSFSYSQPNSTIF